MTNFIFPAIFLASLGGVWFLFWRHFSKLRDLSSDEILARLAASESVRRDLILRYLAPLLAKFYDFYLPTFWKTAEKFVRRIRILVLRLETKLTHLSDKLRGKHVNLDIQERSEYWQSLNNAKNNKKEENLPP